MAHSTRHEVASAALQLTLALATGALVALMPLSLAFSCEAPPPGITRRLPGVADTTYAANARPLLLGSFYDLSGAFQPSITATVDGQPVTATFEALDAVLGAGTDGTSFSEARAIRLDPLPAEGQRVVINATVCDAQWDGLTCETTFDYVAGPAQAAPDAATALVFDVFDHADVRGLSSLCIYDHDLSYYVNVSGGPATSAASSGNPVFYAVDQARSAEFTEVVRRILVLAEGPTARVEFRPYVADLGGASPAEAFCYRVTAFDAAGQIAGKPAISCRPAHCLVGLDPDPSLEEYEAPGEPEWTDAWLYEGECARQQPIPVDDGGPGGTDGGPTGGDGGGGPVDDGGGRPAADSGPARIDAGQDGGNGEGPASAPRGCSAASGRPSATAGAAGLLLLVLALLLRPRRLLHPVWGG